MEPSGIQSFATQHLERRRQRPPPPPGPPSALLRPNHPPPSSQPSLPPPTTYNAALLAKAQRYRTAMGITEEGIPEKPTRPKVPPPPPYPPRRKSRVLSLSSLTSIHEVDSPNEEKALDTEQNSDKEANAGGHLGARKMPLVKAIVSAISPKNKFKSKNKPKLFIDANPEDELVDDGGDEDFNVIKAQPKRAGKRPLFIQTSAKDSNSESSSSNIDDDETGVSVISVGKFEIRESGISGDKPHIGKLKDELLMLGPLGQGACGVVYKAVHTPSLRIVAVKTIPVYDSHKRSQMIKELGALYANIAPIDVPDKYDPMARPAPCPFIVAFHDAFINIEKSNVAMVVEYMDGGSLQDVIDSGSCPSEEVLSQICYRILMGLQFIHHQHQIHRDIKPSNLLINHRGEVKISDFGLTRRVDATLAMASTFVGTLTYMSPERISGAPYNANADIWSLGLSIMSCAIGTYPLSTSGGYWGILHCLNESPVPSLPSEHFSPEFCDFIDKCLDKDPATRPHTDSLLEHPFILGCKEYVDRQMCDESPATNNENCIAELEDIAKAYCEHLYVTRDMNVQLSGPIEVDEARLIKLGSQLGVTLDVVTEKFQMESDYQFDIAMQQDLGGANHLTCESIQSLGSESE